MADNGRLTVDAMRCPGCKRASVALAVKYHTRKKPRWLGDERHYRTLSGKCPECGRRVEVEGGK